MRLSLSAAAAWAADAPAIQRQTVEGVVQIAGWLREDDDRHAVEATGFFVDPDGLVLSVASAFTDAGTRRMCERFEVRLADGRRLPADAHAADPLLNLLLLSVRPPDGGFAVPETAKRMARPDEPVTAVAVRGTPAQPVYASGVVKAQHKRSVYGIGLGDMYIDTRLEPPPGSDGGPLLDAAGKVIGINTPNIHRPADAAVAASEAHALPIRTASGFIKISKHRPLSAMTWLGVAFRPLRPDEAAWASALLGRRAGVYVDFVWSEGPAGSADIRAGDILVALDGQDVADLFRLERRLDEFHAGDRVELALLRGEGVVSLRLRVEQRPRWAGFVPWRMQ